MVAVEIAGLAALAAALIVEVARLGVAGIAAADVVIAATAAAARVIRLAAVGAGMRIACARSAAGYWTGQRES